jgi:tRNA(fMet)-specific endonuclease VapC
VLKGRDPAVAAQAASAIANDGRLAVTVVTVLEVVSGWQRMQREDRIAGFLSHLGDLEILGLGVAAAARAGRIEGDLARAGQPIGRADSIIAAIAIVEGRTLVTGNTGHYERIARLGHDLRLENWRSG